MITKKHLVPLAKAIRDLGVDLVGTDYEESYLNLRAEVAKICDRDNERFDWARFLEASHPHT
jgi:hypothetical protein